MLDNMEFYLDVENIYLIANWGVVPFWLLLIFAPDSKLTKFFVYSVVTPLLLSTAYIFIGYKIYLEGEIFGAFGLYNGLEDLYAVFSNENFLLIFWLHFLSISLFLGSWIARDSLRYSVPKIILVISLTITYFSGPVGILIYWFFRIFFAKKISLNE